MELAFFVLQLVVGLTFVAHAAQKLFRVFGGQGIESTADTFDQIGLRPSKLNAWPASHAPLNLPQKSPSPTTTRPIPIRRYGPQRADQPAHPDEKSV
jgi:hypothetical protein